MKRCTSAVLFAGVALDSLRLAMVDRIATVPGSGFDLAYIAGMIKAHEMEAKDFESKAATTKDPDPKAFVAAFAPVLQEHLRRITTPKQ